MADDAEQVLVKINGDSSSLEEAAKRSRTSMSGLGNEAEKTEKKIKDSGGGKDIYNTLISKSGSAGQAVDGIASKFKSFKGGTMLACAAAGAAVVGFSADAIKSYLKIQPQIVAFQKLAGNSHWSKEIQESSQESFGLISEDSARAGASVAASMGISGEAYEKLKPHLGDLAAKMGGAAHASENYETASKLMSRAISSGAAGVLSRYGIVLDKNQQKMFANADQEERATMVSGLLQKTMGGLNDTLAATPSGAFSQLKNSTDDFKIALGGLLTGNVSPEEFSKKFAALGKAIGNMMKAIGPMVIGGLKNIGVLITESIPKLINFAEGLPTKIANGLSGALSAAVKKLPSLIKGLAHELPKILGGLFSGLITILPNILIGIAKLVFAIIKALPSILLAIIQAIPTLLQGIWDAIVHTAAAGIKAFGKLFKTIFGGLSGIFDPLEKSVKDMWDKISGVFKGAWDWIKSHVIDAWNREIAGWKTIFKDLGKIIKTVWSGISGAFGTAWNWIKAHVIDAWNHEINGWKTIFRDLGNVISTIWNAIKGAFGEAWGWINNNVIQPFASGMHWLGDRCGDFKNMVSNAWDAIKDAAMKPVKFIVNTVYTNGIEKLWNDVAGAIGLNKLKLPDVRFASGGVLDGYAPGQDSVLAMLSPGEAIMRPEWARAMGSTRIGQLNDMARTGRLQGFANGGIVGDIGRTAKIVAEIFTNPKQAVDDYLLGPIQGMIKGIGAGDFGQMVSQIPIKIVDSIGDSAKKFVESMFAAGGGAVGGAGVQRWAPLVLQALAMLGQPPSWLNTVLRRMNQESGGNPNAINRWDSNAAAGHPSEGLMQCIQSTFDAYAGPFIGRGILDPLANIYAGINYCIHRYGSIAGMDRPGGYFWGGLHPYDNEIAGFQKGEFTINKRAAQNIGYGRLQDINASGKLPDTGVIKNTTINVSPAHGDDPLAFAHALYSMSELLN